MNCIFILGYPNCGKTDIVRRLMRNSKQNIEFLELPNKYRSQFLTTSDNTYKQLVSCIKKISQSNPDKLIIEGFPLNITNYNNILTTLSKVFDSILILEIECDKPLLETIRNKKEHRQYFNYYNIQSKLGLHSLQNNIIPNLPVYYSKVKFKNNTLSNYNKVKKVLNEFDFGNQESEQLELDFSDPDKVCNFLIELYKDSNNNKHKLFAKELEKIKGN